MRENKPFHAVLPFRGNPALDKSRIYAQWFPEITVHDYRLPGGWETGLDCPAILPK
jgi:hypothetical protein